MDDSAESKKYYLNTDEYKPLVGIKVVSGESFLLVLTLKKEIYEKDDSFPDIDWQ